MAQCGTAQPMGWQAQKTLEEYLETEQHGFRDAAGRPLELSRGRKLGTIKSRCPRTAAAPVPSFEVASRAIIRDIPAA
jgi:hypothetical protein